MRNYPCEAAGGRATGSLSGPFSFQGPRMVDVMVCADSSRAEEQIDRGGGVEVWH